mmetsp:Transcript_17977/g.31511  ORF Transcript_17977/g.31511 Transcript_17977/m.31511 type:complete len:675 (-) Transcript_17977:1346-3370(-)
MTQDQQEHQQDHQQEPVCLLSPDLSFPWRLYKLLQDQDGSTTNATTATSTSTPATTCGCSISWISPKVFQIHDPALLETTVLPRYFGHSIQFASFRRQLTAYGFQSLGQKKYTHQDFSRDDPQGCERVVRVYKKKTKPKNNTAKVAKPNHTCVPSSNNSVASHTTDATDTTSDTASDTAASSNTSGTSTSGTGTQPRIVNPPWIIQEHQHEPQHESQQQQQQQQQQQELEPFLSRIQEEDSAVWLPSSSFSSSLDMDMDMEPIPFQAETATAFSTQQTMHQQRQQHGLRLEELDLEPLLMDTSAVKKEQPPNHYESCLEPRSIREMIQNPLPTPSVLLHPWFRYSPSFSSTQQQQTLEYMLPVSLFVLFYQFHLTKWAHVWALVVVILHSYECWITNFAKENNTSTTKGIGPLQHFQWDSLLVHSMLSSFVLFPQIFVIGHNDDFHEESHQPSQKALTGILQMILLLHCGQPWTIAADYKTHFMTFLLSSSSKTSSTISTSTSSSQQQQQQQTTHDERKCLESLLSSSTSAWTTRTPMSQSEKVQLGTVLQLQDGLGRHILRCTILYGGVAVVLFFGMVMCNTSSSELSSLSCFTSLLLFSYNTCPLLVDLSYFWEFSTRLSQLDTLQHKTIVNERMWLGRWILQKKQQQRQQQQRLVLSLPDRDDFGTFKTPV